jgi:hypothetical protein
MKGVVGLSLARLGALLLLALALVIPSVSGVRAQNTARYFPETGHFLGGLFLLFWETNGGVELFGYPITEEYVDSERGRTVQYFERARFELTEYGGLPYIELGRLGAEVTAGRAFATTQPVQSTDEWLYFPETQHIVQHGFKQVWETRGGLRIFGLPISEEITEVFPSGQFRTVQYFERVRFEYWPERPEGQRVVLSNLGRMLAPPALQQPLSPDAAPGTLPATGNQGNQGGEQSEGGTGTTPAVPTWKELAFPTNVNAQVTPQVGAPGDSFSFTAHGFEPDEQVGVWVTSPEQITFNFERHVHADGEGSIAHEDITITTKHSYTDGIWSVNAQGVESGKSAVGYFRLSRVINQPPGNPELLGLLIHDTLPSSENALIVPLAAPRGTIFTLSANGFTPNEDITGWVTVNNTDSIPIDSDNIQFDQGGTVQMEIASDELGEGTYTAVARGNSSGVVGVANFKVTSSYLAGPNTPRPANFNGEVSPSEGGPGTLFRLRGHNLLPGEALEFWITNPTGTYTLLPDSAVADEQGRIGYTPALDMFVGPDLSPGVYGFHFRGKASGTRVDLYYTYTGLP